MHTLSITLYNFSPPMRFAAHNRACRDVVSRSLTLTVRTPSICTYVPNNTYGTNNVVNIVFLNFFNTINTYSNEYQHHMLYEYLWICSWGEVSPNEVIFLLISLFNSHTVDSNTYGRVLAPHRAPHGNQAILASRSDELFLYLNHNWLTRTAITNRLSLSRSVGTLTG